MARRPTMAKPKDYADMKVSELRDTHPYYDANIRKWKLYIAAYEGVDAMVDLGVFEKHERESDENYNRRMNELYGFNYTKAIVELFNLYLFKRVPKRDLGVLQDDIEWERFGKDCNYDGMDWDKFLLMQSLMSNVYGHVGVLVDSPDHEAMTLEEQRAYGIYPYVSSYHPPAILDWEYKRQPSGHYRLEYVKLKDDDGTFRIWTPDSWYIYEEPDDDDKEIWYYANNRRKSPDAVKAVLVNSGAHELGEVPFVWVYNTRSRKRCVGTSDVVDIVKIDISIVRNLSQGEEVICYGAFPMMRKPWPEKGADRDNKVSVGSKAVLGFDPERPETKPDWLSAAVGEPIQAILSWLDRKVQEIYRIAQSGGQTATEVNSQPKSGIALKTEFQLLNSKLVSKGDNLTEAELSIIKLWLLWQGKGDLFEDIVVQRDKTYDVEDLKEDLENVLTSLTIVRNPRFTAMMKKAVVRMMLPNYTESELSEIDQAIMEEVERADIFSRVKEESELSFYLGVGNEDEEDEAEGSQTQ
jgi:hypothetical protein